MRSITCFGSGEGKSGEVMYDAMQQVGNLLAVRGMTVVTGGYGGAGMEAPSLGAIEASGSTLGYIHRESKRVNPYLTHLVDCEHMARSLPCFPAAYAIRMAALLNSEGFITAAGGGAGIFLELIGFIVYAKKIWPALDVEKRMAILRPYGWHPLSNDTCWNEAMLEQLGTWGVLRPRERELIKIVTTPQQAVGWVLFD